MQSSLDGSLNQSDIDSDKKAYGSEDINNKKDWREDPKLPRNRNFEKYVEYSKQKFLSLSKASDEGKKLRRLMYMYTGSGYSKNEEIRRLTAAGEQEEAAKIAKPYSDGIETLREKGELAVKENPVFCGQTNHTRVIEGGEVCDPAPRSSSIDPKCALAFAIKDTDVSAKNGTMLAIFNATAANISGVSPQLLAVKEAEALIMPGQKFNVLLKGYDEKNSVYKAVLEKKEAAPEKNENVPQRKRRHSL